MIRRRRHITQRPEYFRLNPESDLSRGLVFAGLGRFPGGYRYDDATESLWGGGNPGTLTNMDPASDWVYSPELGRWGLDFDGSNDYISCPNYSPNHITISAWVRVAVGTYGYILTKNFSNNVLPYSLNVGGNTSPQNLNGFGFYIFNKGWSSTGFTTDIRGTGYRHVCGTYDGNELKYWIDGRLDHSKTAVGTLPTNDAGMAIGRYANDNQYCNGMITDVMMWDHALSPAQIATLASRDPMLGGWIKAPRRQSFAAASLAASPLFRRRLLLAGAA
jgi:hypothetical protein